MDVTLEQRLRFYRELIHCAHDLYFWSFNEQFETTFTNCPDASVFEMIFSLSRTAEIVTGDNCDRSTPIVFTSTMGMVWIVACLDAPQQETSYHLIGPAFFDDVTQPTIYEGMQRLKLSPSLQHEFISILDKLPVIPMTRMFEYAFMLHYTLTGERITTSQLQMLSASTQSIAPSSPPQRRHGTWAAEQAMLKLVEDGNLEQWKQQERFMTTGNVGKMSAGNPLRQVKNQIIVFTALCTRAAVRGGLSPETAYSLSDHYIQLAEACATISDLAEISRLMPVDFIRRVHECKISNGTSKQIQICKDYIQMHLSERVTVETLAQHVGYSATYLSRKFKQETGKNILDYINDCRIDRAKQMLISCELSIQEISEQLGFGTQSYFGAQFKKITGLSATEFRNQYGRDDV